jgi:D-isomer specific 2-hydroxyacid dehydrogenase, catalytic domain/D-isomer specific 2-hydroxyacid dehydrogenase, NAD binding domain
MLACWFYGYGFDVTIVKRAASVRGGGYPIDIRGTAVEAMDRMGLLPKLQAAHIDAQKIAFVGADGLSIGSIPPEALTGGELGRDTELPQGDDRPAKRRKIHSSLQLPNYDRELSMGKARVRRVAILDDYAHAALEVADWSPVKKKAEVTVFDRHLSEDEAVETLHPFDLVCTLRERMAFPRTLIERLPNLKLITIDGMSLQNLDMAAASERGILVAHSNFAKPRFAAAGNSTPELVLALMIATMRNLTEEHRRMREGRWQASAGGTLDGKTLGLLGLGRIGKRLNEYAKSVWDGGYRLEPESYRRGGGRCAPRGKGRALQGVRRGLNPRSALRAHSRSRPCSRTRPHEAQRLFNQHFQRPDRR